MPGLCYADYVAYVEKLRIERRQLIDERVPAKICEITFEAFPVEHSIRAPAVGYRVRWGGGSVFYSPDVVFIHARAEALRNIRIYIGDGATIYFFKRGEELIGHAPIRSATRLVHGRACASRDLHAPWHGNGTWR